MQDKSARDALNTFLGGKGDALLTYENEALLAQRSGQAVYFNIPKATIRIDNPLAVIEEEQEQGGREGVRQVPLHADGAEAVRAERLPARRAEREKGYSFPVRPQLFTIDYLGGWTKAHKKFFDPNNGLMAKIEASLGG